MRCRKFDIVFILLLSSAFFSAAVFAAGIEPPSMDTDCDCLQWSSEQNAYVGIASCKKGEYIKGTWTASPDVDNNGTPVSDRFYVHLFLKHGNEVLVKSIQTLTGGALTPCGLSEELIKEALFDAPCRLQIEEAPFNRTGTPIIKDISITNRNCGATAMLKQDIIRGEITIEVLPTEAVCTE